MPIPRLSRLVAVSVLSAVTWWVLSGQAVASLRVSPLVLEATLDGGSQRLGPVYVTNAAKEPLDVQVELVGLTHDLEGYPVFLADEPARIQAANTVRPSWQQARLEPGESRALWFEPVGRRKEGAYLAALVSAPVPTGTLQVAVLLLLLQGQRPGATPALVLEGVWAEQQGPGEPVEIVARVSNPHPIHGQAHGEATIVGPDGAVAGRVTLGPSRLLPGTARLLRGRWQPLTLPPGRYVVEARLHGPDGSRPFTATAAVDVVRPYELAQLSGWVSVALRPGGGAAPSLVASVHNGSARPVRPVLLVKVTGGESVSVSTRVEGAEVNPGEVAGVEVPWPSGLAPGDYRVEVVWVDGIRTVASDALDVTLAPAVAHRPLERRSP